MASLENDLERPRQAVILAGGRGTRMRPFSDTLPKAMVCFHGKPFLQYLVEMLRDEGFEEILLLLGYLPDKIVDHFGSGGDLGVKINYSVLGPDDLTSRRLQAAEDMVDPRFLLLYCDNYWPMSFDEMWRSYVASRAEAQVTVYSNWDGYSRSNVEIGPDGFVKRFDRSRNSSNLQGVDIGFVILRKDVLFPLLTDVETTFEEAVYPTLSRRRTLHAFVTDHRYYSVGSVERLALTDSVLGRRPTAVIMSLDPDGRSQEAFEHERMDALSASRRAVIQELHSSGINVVLLATEPSASSRRQSARVRLAGEGDDEAFVEWMEPSLSERNLENEAEEVLYHVQHELNLDLRRTWCFVDNERDSVAASRVGCRAVMAATGEALNDASRQMVGTIAGGDIR
jgi:choline kinase